MLSEKFNSEKTFKKENHHKVVFQGIDFYNCHFEGCIFTNATFWDCSFEHCVFTECDLSNINLEGSAFSGVVFKQSKAIGVQWHKAGLSFQVDFISCTLNYASFFKRNLKNIRIIDCQAQEVDFAECNLHGADFHGTNLQKSRFLNSDLRKADFSGAFDYFVDLSCNKVKKAIFSLPEVLSLFKNFDITIK